MRTKYFNQKQICLKLDEDNTDLLEREIFASGFNRNRLINIAIREWIRIRDIDRSLGCCPGYKGQFLKKQFEAMGMKHISEQFLDE